MIEHVLTLATVSVAPEHALCVDQTQPAELRNGIGAGCSAGALRLPDV
jgi:hypothetical protein